MEKKTGREKSSEFLITRSGSFIKETALTTNFQGMASTPDEQVFIGHSRNTRKKNYYQVSRG